MLPREPCPPVSGATETMLAADPEPEVCATLTHGAPACTDHGVPLAAYSRSRTSTEVRNEENRCPHGLLSDNRY